ncbi:MAG: ABC transporter ATP-binding protein [Alphaproteobacteria bacterium]|nr:ABC transporter ATP-binding protein [Alphaproteobacteria bacterium]
MREILKIFFRTGGWRRQAMVLGCLLLAVLAESIGLASVLPLFSVALGEGGSPRSALDRAVYSMLDFLRLKPELNILLLIVVVGFSLNQLLAIWSKSHVGAIVARIATEFRLSLVDLLLQARWRYFAGQPAGRFLANISSEAQTAATAYQDAARVITQAVHAASYLLLALLVSWQVFLAAVAVGLVSSLVLRRLVTSSRRHGRKQVKHSRLLLADLTDILTGMKPLKAMGKHLNLAPLLASHSRRVHRALRRQVTARAFVQHLREPIEVACLAGAFYVAIRWLHYDAPQLLLLGVLLGKSVKALSGVQAAVQSALIAAPAYWALTATIDGLKEEGEDWPGRAEPRFERALELRHASFAYPGRAVLEDVSLVVEAGRLTTVTGPSGAGKTTIADLLIGLHRPDAGEVLMDGRPLAEIDIAAWRRQVGYVPQEVMLLNGSILDNLTLGDPALTEADARAALELAGAWDFVAQQPERLRALVGERGMMLSGGQRQRLAIARALIRRPKLLILDEATSALDPGTERAICEHVRGLAGRLTILAITHQPAWVNVADRCYRLEDRRVAVA